MERKRVFSGIQPTGTVHIGNYFGAIKQWIALQDDYDALYCIVDLHAITVPQKPSALRQNIINMAKWYIAAGIDPQKSTIFVQSDIPAHSELAWILNTIARMGDMEKMTQFKDKSGDGRERASVALFDYPVLMAADILLYDTHIVPVGDDQVQHVELTRTLARRYNKRFGETFIVPRTLLSHGARIMGLDNPHKKMSKSAVSVYNYIALTDNAETIRKKIKKAVTDSGSEIVYSDDKPALKNLLTLYHLATGTSFAELEARYAQSSYGEFKRDLAEALIDHIVPIQERFSAISDEEVHDILTRGAARARAYANEKMRAVRALCGLGHV